MNRWIIGKTVSGTKAFDTDDANTPNQSQMWKISNAAEMGENFRGASKKWPRPSFSKKFSPLQLVGGFSMRH